ARIHTEAGTLPASQPCNSLEEARRSNVLNPHHNAGGAPATDPRTRPKAPPRHDEPAGERVAVAMPRIAIQTAPIPPRAHQDLPGALDGGREELVCLLVRAPKDGLSGILGTLTLPGQVHEHRANNRVHRYLSGIAAL